MLVKALGGIVAFANQILLVSLVFMFNAFALNELALVGFFVSVSALATVVLLFRGGPFVAQNKEQGWLTRWLPLLVSAVSLIAFLWSRNTHMNMFIQFTFCLIFALAIVHSGIRDARFWMRSAG
jgi:hypothetical protein